MIRFKYNTKTNNLIENDFNNPGIILITGINGSGKTHFLKSLAGIIKNPNITYSRKISPLVNYVSYVSDQLINCNYTVCELIKLVHPQITDFLFVDSSLINKPFNLLSSGQKKIVQIFLGLAHNPKILLLDEPENNLDHDNLSLFKSFILEYSKENLVFIASHNTSFYKYESEIKIY